MDRWGEEARRGVERVVNVRGYGARLVDGIVHAAALLYGDMREGSLRLESW